VFAIPHPPSSTPCLWALVLLLSTAAAFSPVLTAGFLNWDDEENVVFCPPIRSFAPPNLLWMLTNFTVGDFKPLVCFNYAVDYSLWSLNPFGFHLSNLLLHCLNSLLLFVLLLVLARRSLPRPLALVRRSAERVGGERAYIPAPPAAPCRPVLRLHPGFGGQVRTGGPSGILPAAFFSALFFALHPLRTETVAWISDRKDLLCVFFYFLALLSYIRFAARGRPFWYISALLFGLLSALSKAVAVSLPAVMLGLDWYPLERLRGRVARAVLEKVPFALIALAAAGIAFYGQAAKGALSGLDDISLAGRLLLAVRSTLFYLEKTVLPSALAGAYPPLDRAPVAPFRLVAAFCFFSVLLLAPVRAGGRMSRLSALGLAWFGICLLPVSGILKTGVVTQADRFSYLPAAGLSLLLLAPLGYLAARFPSAFALGAAAGGLFLGLFSWDQAHAWKNPESLWSAAVRAAPTAPAARTHYGQVLYSAGRMAEAEIQLRAALRLMDEQGVGRDGMRFAAASNLGRALKNLGRFEEASAIFNGLLESGDEWVIHHSLAGTYQAMGKKDLAEDEYRAVLRRRPGFVPALCDLGLLLAQNRRLDEAMDLYRTALRLSPGSPRARYNLALAHLDRGESEAGIELLEGLRREFPESALAARALIVAYTATGKGDQAREVEKDWPPEKLAGESYLPYSLEEKPGLMTPLYLQE